MTTRVDAPYHSPRVVVRRTHDADEIERVLRSDAFDAPIPYFTDALLRTAVRTLLAPSAEVYFVVAEMDGSYAGFAFGHTLGPTFWRSFARRHVLRHPFALATLTFRLKIARPIRQRLARARSSPSTSLLTASSQEDTLVPRVERPFDWSASRPDIGQLDQLFVSRSCRGSGVGSRLLGMVTSEMSREHVTLIEAHVDGGNVASLKAFLKAGWTAVQMRDGDYYLSYRPATPDASAVRDKSPR
jgi:hypothetical protein